jgi:hypothetical protein
MLSEFLKDELFSKCESLEQLQLVVFEIHLWVILCINLGQEDAKWVVCTMCCMHHVNC